ncbi:hypothetical protein [Halovivax gelatinilyticus]|uniref:hypothetical protein n=1 Tax=Halovivax gelatinilyticus TaxID=2961597 RepID=UPI0020CA50B0|nr:hypothetical protein [Halovivax gelatinilyticus]
MTYRRALVGDDDFPSGLAVAVVLLTVVGSFAHVIFTAVVESLAPATIDALLFAAPAVVAVVAVAVCTYRGQGILFGWLVGVAMFYAPFYLLIRGMADDSGASSFVEPLFGALLWGFVFSFAFCLAGLIVGGSLRLITRSADPEFES